MKSFIEFIPMPCITRRTPALSLSLSLSSFLVSLLVTPNKAFSQGNCQTPPEPPTALAGCNTLEPGNGNCDSIDNASYILRVFPHIVRDDNGNGGQPYSKVKGALDKLMDAYAPLNISFSIEGLGYVDDSTYFSYVGGGGTNDPEYTALTSEDHSDERLDIYFLPPGVYNNGKGFTLTTSCVIGGGKELLWPSNIDCTPAAELITTHILAHEVGHNLGLFHTFEKSANDPNDDCLNNPSDCNCWDRVFDTSLNLETWDKCIVCVPPPFANCYINRTTSCDSLFFLIPENYDTSALVNIMSYSPYQCITKFTPGQGHRMKRYINECSILQEVVTNEQVLRINDGFELVYDDPYFDDCHPDIIVEDGGKLTLTVPLEFASGKGIHVKGGGIVEVDGVTLSGCNGGPWRGIKVDGTSASQANLQAKGQGQLVLKPGSVLLNADSAIVATKGAFVHATDTDFTNCGTVSFEDYPKSLSLSRFVSCDFLRNGNYLFTHSEQFRLDNIGRIVIEDCTFLTDGANNDIAISSLDSRFFVRGGASSIEGFETGVATSSVNNSFNFAVKDCLFKDNRVGVESFGADNFSFRDNIFDGIGAFDGSDEQAGIKMTDCIGFEIIGNTFKGVSAPENIGILAANTSPNSESHEIVGNFFEGLHAANWAIGDNKGSQIGSGLQYLCNTNKSSNGNSHDFLVWDVGIAGNQGGNLATKNIFSHFDSTTFSDFNNQGALLDYFHGTPTEETPQMGYYSNISPQFSSLDYGCDGGTGIGGQLPPFLPHFPIKLDTAKLLNLEGIFNLAKTNHDSVLTVYNNLLNGGQIEVTLVAQIMSATAQDTTQLEQDLLADSPYLTTTVLEAVVNRSDIFSDNSIQNILTANADELRSLDFHSFLYTELDAALVDSILTAQNQHTARTTDIGELTRYKMDMHRAANRMIKDVLWDSTGVNYTKYRLWLDNKGSMEAEYEKVTSYIMESDFVNARSVRDSLPIVFNLQGGDLTEHGYFKDLTEIIITALEDTIPTWGYDSATVTQVYFIAENSVQLAGAMAKGLLNFHYGYNYQIVPSGSGGQQLIGQKPSFPNRAQAMPPRLTALPNPAKDVVTFKYDLESGNKATLSIFNMEGKMVKSFALNDMRGSIEWVTAAMPHGIYYCQVKQAGKNYPALKLAIIK